MLEAVLKALDLIDTSAQRVSPVETCLNILYADHENWKLEALQSYESLKSDSVAGQIPGTSVSGNLETSDDGR